MIVVLDLIFRLGKIDEIAIIIMASNAIRRIQPKQDFICQTLLGGGWERMTLCVSVTALRLDLGGTSAVRACRNANREVRERLEKSVARCL